jgi:hypothetical protein
MWKEVMQKDVHVRKLRSGSSERQRKLEKVGCLAQKVETKDENMVPYKSYRVGTLPQN